MRLNLELDNSTLVQEAGFRTVARQIPVVWKDTANVDVYFYDNGYNVALTEGAVGIFIVKENYPDAEPLVRANGWTKQTDAVGQIYYRFTPSFDTETLEDKFLAETKDYVDMRMQIRWIIGSSGTTSIPSTVRIYNQLIRDASSATDLEQFGALAFLSQVGIENIGSSSRLGAGTKLATVHSHAAGDYVQFDADGGLIPAPPPEATASENTEPEVTQTVLGAGEKLASVHQFAPGVYVQFDADGGLIPADGPGNVFSESEVTDGAPVIFDGPEGKRIKGTTLSAMLDAALSNVANGDILIRLAGVWTRVALGAAGTRLQSTGTTLEYSAVPQEAVAATNASLAITVNRTSFVGRYTRLTGTGNKTLTLQNEATAGWVAGDTCYFRMAGTGNMTLAGSGITFNGSTSTFTQHTTFALRYVGSNTWDVI
ncbi:hypothetical protein EBZ80_14285 [bacterium]|nr:hypothetical protein [bacterium]